MRLRITVQRHELPTTRILWPVVKPDQTTVAQLLEDIHEVLPLESGEWGLDDYVAELPGGFECLHFATVASLLHDEDELLIRPLLTDDLRARRINGRHQISTDGRHLVDGVAYGRPRLRKPANRPPIMIPPRKRRRITHDEYAPDEESTNLGLIGTRLFDEEDDDLQPRRRALTFLPHDDIDRPDESDEDEDEDYNPDRADASSVDESDEGSENGSELEREVRPRQVAIHADFDGVDSEDENEDYGGNEDENETEEVEYGGDEYNDLSPAIENSGTPSTESSELAEKIKRMKLVFPTVPDAFCRRVLIGCDGNEGKAREAMARGFRPSTPSQRTPENGSRKRKQPVSELSESEASEDGESALDFYDNNGFPPGSISVGSTKSKAKVVFSSPNTSSKPSEEEADSSESSESSEEESEDDSSSVSASDSGEDVSVAKTNGKGHSKLSALSGRKEAEGGSSSSSDSGSKNNEDSESESDSSSAVSSPSEADSAPEEQSSKNVPVAPGRGKRSTQKRNQRRRIHNAIQRLVHKGLVPAGVGVEDVLKLAKDPSALSADVLSALDTIRKFSSVTTNEDQPMPPVPEDGSIVSQPPATDEASLLAAKQRELLASLGTEEDSGTPAVAVDTPELASSDAAIRSRKKIDLGASRRLVFGALGVRAPKTKDDEAKLRTDLMKSVRQVQPVQSVDPEPAPAPEDSDSDSWRKRINLRAVECCHEGVVLSEPPFPFVQRWDPQQQGNWHSNGRGGKGKRSQRDQADFYEENRPSKKRNNRKNQEYDDDAWDEIVLNYDEDEVEKEIPESHRDVEDDLPPLPADISALPDLRQDDVGLLAIIAFKQLDMSEATGWQPRISKYRTAKVLAIDEGKLWLSLAKRDREHREKQYDEETGERIYGRFEVPDDDDDDDEAEDDGERAILFADLIEPKLLKVGIPYHRPKFADLSSPKDNEEQKPASSEASALNSSNGADKSVTPGTLSAVAAAAKDAASVETPLLSPKFNGIGIESPAPEAASENAAATSGDDFIGFDDDAALPSEERSTAQQNGSSASIHLNQTPAEAPNNQAKVSAASGDTLETPSKGLRSKAAAAAKGPIESVNTIDLTHSDDEGSDSEYHDSAESPAVRARASNRRRKSNPLPARRRSKRRST